MDIPTLTTKQIAEVDRLMIEEYSILLIQMMENAGRNLALQAKRMLVSLIGKEVVVLCGSGNNGGGGMVAARHLHNWGASIWVTLVGEENRLKEAPAHQWRILKAMGMPGAALPASPPEHIILILDAIIGYGLQGNPHGRAAEWIKWAMEHRCPILALDAPSGLDTTSGKPGNPCIQATATLTLALPKTGLLTSQAQPFVGDLYLADISVPPELYHHLGIKVGSLFAEDTILPITSSPHTSS